jgi:thiol-disulfide isomerase/thioredoxin
MKHIGLALRLLLVIALVGCTTMPPVTPLPATPLPATATASAEVAPDFRLTTLAGQPLALADLRDRWVLINFWATWCLPCRDEMPYLQQLADQHADQLVVVGVNMRETDDVVRPFVEELGLTFPILLQPDNATLLAYDVRGLPISLLVSPQGAIVLRQVGPLEAALFDPWLLKMLQQ